MVPITLHPVSEVDFEQFTSAFNLAYSDYFTPIVMTPGSFRALMQHDDLSLAASVAAIDHGEIVGTGLLGIRGHTGWIGGMGVIPGRRRQGIGRQMMEYLIAQAQRRGLHEVTLEVIEANEGAFALYHSFGFDITRYLLVMEREPAEFTPHDDNVTIQSAPPQELLSFYDAFHDIPNCWQRGYRSLANRAEFIHGWGAFCTDRPVGYALGWARSYEIRLADLAASPGPTRTHIARALLSHLHARYPEAYGSSYNVTEDDPTLHAYTDMGYTVTFRQIEMRLSLRTNAARNAGQ